MYAEPDRLSSCLSSGRKDEESDLVYVERVRNGLPQVHDCSAFAEELRPTAKYHPEFPDCVR